MGYWKDSVGLWVQHYDHQGVSLSSSTISTLSFPQIYPAAALTVVMTRFMIVGGMMISLSVFGSVVKG